MLPLTAVDALYATQFPTYDELHKLVLQVNMEWEWELGPNNHLLLKRIFDSKLNEDVVREVGNEINERGGYTAMVANFLIYCHLIGGRLNDMGLEQEQWHEMHQNHAKHIEVLWGGVGQWQA